MSALYGYATSALRYVLTDAPVSLEPLTVMDTRSFCWRGWWVDCHVLAASHAVCLTGPAGGLTELLACMDPAWIPPGGFTRSADTGWEVCLEQRGLCCRARLVRCVLQGNMDLCGHYQPESRMRVTYPARAGLPVPVTCLGWCSNGEWLQVETLHTYPEEGVAVRTWTVFTAAAGTCSLESECIGGVLS
ncbi:MAG: DUF2617 family protein [Chthonomonadaceae bacterium]|nr:DUF2617 family protein [Chthonomonadaceae bacterium]